MRKEEEEAERAEKKSKIVEQTMRDTGVKETAGDEV